MDIQVLDENPLYQNQIYRLKFTFSSKYPIGMSLCPPRRGALIVKEFPEPDQICVHRTP